MGQIKLSVILPSFNESENLKTGVLDKVEDYLKNLKINYEVIIVDDGSKDKTIEIINESIKNKKNFRLIENSHNGKAITVMTGMMEAKGEIVLFADMDQATPIDQIAKFFPRFEEGADIVIGSRTGRKGAPFFRKLTAWGFSVLRNLILGLPLKDTQCGFKAFNQKAVQLIFPKLLKSWENMKTKGGGVNAGFDIEVLFIAKSKDLEIAEVDVEWHYVGTERVQVIKDSIDAIKDMLRIRVNSLLGRYNNY